MDEKLILMKLEGHDRILEEHEDKLTELDKRVDQEEKNSTVLSIELRNLNENIKNFVKLLKWFMGALGAVIGFIFYLVERGAIK